MYKPNQEETLHNIKLLASKSFQERVWLNGIGPEVSDFNEAVLRYYFNIPKIEAKALERLKTAFNEEEIDVLMKFHCILNNFINTVGWELSHKELLENQEWINVREEAKKVCNYFKVELLK